MKQGKDWTLGIGHWSLRNQGFSLIELMFAIVFLTIIILGVVKLQTSNLVLSNTQNNQFKAYFWANQGIEIVEVLGVTEINSKCSLFPCDKYINKSGSSYILGDTDNVIEAPFQRIIKIEQDANLPNAYKVTSIIEWSDNTGDHNLADGGAVTVKRIIF